MRLEYSHIKQIKINYEVQFPTDPKSNDKIKKNSIKKGHKKIT
jgi:hypothetical protein